MTSVLTDPTLERRVLAEMNRRADALAQGIHFLENEVFTLEDHKRVYHALCLCFEGGVPASRDALLLRLPSRLTDLINSLATIPSPTSFEDSVTKLREVFAARQLVAAVDVIRSRATADPGAVHELVDRMDREACRIGSGLSRDSVSAEPLDRLLEPVGDGRQATGAMPGITTGMEHLDRLIGGWRPGTVSVLVGPARSTTWLAAYWFGLAAATAGRGTLVHTSAHSAEYVALQLLGLQAGCSVEELRSEVQDRVTLKKIAAARARLAKVSLYVSDTPELTLMNFRHLCQRLHAGYGLGFVSVSEAGLLVQDGQEPNHVAGEIGKWLQGIARELDVPVIVTFALPSSCAPRDLLDAPAYKHLVGVSETIIAVDTIPGAEKAPRLRVLHNRWGECGTVVAPHLGSTRESLCSVVSEDEDLLPF